ncbi:MAG: hypothetical protein Q9227_008999 [Pyrenula ochraceoflavens]
MSKDQQNGQQQASELAQAFEDVARGERAASALERGLTSIEEKINLLLEKAEKDEASLKQDTTTNGQNNSDKTKPAPSN